MKKLFCLTRYIMRSRGIEHRGISKNNIDRGSLVDRLYKEYVGSNRCYEWIGPYFSPRLKLDEKYGHTICFNV